MDEIIQLEITLLGTEPPIWRRILVEKETTFLELHNIIQIAMGWENYHLYEFVIKGYRITELREDFVDYLQAKAIDPSELTLGSVLTKPKEKLRYIYDFGDDWNHQIVVEKFLPRNAAIKYPICTDGELNCPPEDCGGVWGFYDLLDIISTKGHPERDEMLEWLGGEYDSEYFNKEEINSELKTLSK